MFRSRSFAVAIAICAAALNSCAKKPMLQDDCNRETGQARGLKDGRAARGPDLSFLQGCTDEARASSLAAYRESYEAARAKKVKGDEGEEVESAQPLKPPAILPGREPAAESWVCEVEANSKVFTGTGLSREEALGLARGTCSSHFQASYCTESSCKKNL